AAAPAELPEDPRRNDLFGAAIAEDGEWLAIGAPGDNDRAFNGGAVYLFELGGAAPRLRHKLHADDPRPQAWFGAALAIDGERLIVGGADELTRSFDTPPGHGAAWIFRRDGDAWEEEAHLQLDDAGVLAETYGAGVA